MAGRVPRTGRGPLGVAAAVMAIGFAWAFASPASSAQASASISIFDDDGGQAMFTNAVLLGPGHPVSACISVGADPMNSEDVVAFGATDVAGDLLPYLTVTVDRGTGGHFGDCTGFSGATLYTGLLLDLAAAGNGGGVDTGWHPSAAATQTFRITVLVDPSLTTQDLTAQGRFVWRITSDAVPPQPSPSPTPSVSVSPSPSPTVDPPSDPPLPPVPPDPVPTATGGPGPTSTTASDPSVAPTPAPSVTAGATPSASGSGTPSPRRSRPADGGTPTAAAGPAPDLTIGGTLAQLQEVVGRAQRAAADVVSSPQYPLSAISLAMGFLLVQDLIDRRDPKLAVVSRSQRDNEVTFPDRFAGTRSASRTGSRPWLHWPWDDAGGAA